MATDIDKLADAINRLAEVHETGFTDIAKSLEFVGQQIGALSDPDNGLAFESYSELKTDMADSIKELTEVLKPNEEPKPSKPKKKAN